MSHEKNEINTPQINTPEIKKEENENNSGDATTNPLQGNQEVIFTNTSLHPEQQDPDENTVLILKANNIQQEPETKEEKSLLLKNRYTIGVVICCGLVLLGTGVGIWKLVEFEQHHNNNTDAPTTSPTDSPTSQPTTSGPTHPPTTEPTTTPTGSTSSPTACVNPQSNQNYRVAVNVSQTEYTAQVFLENKGTTSWSFNELQFDTSEAIPADAIIGLPPFTLVRQNNTNIIKLNQPLNIPANSTTTTSYTLPLPTNSQEFSQEIYTSPDNLGTRLNGTAHDVLYAGADVCIESPIPQMFALRMSAPSVDSDLSITTENIDPYVNTFLAGYLYVRDSGNVNGNNPNWDNQLFANIQNYRQLRPHMKLILEVQNYDVEKLSANQSELDNFLRTMDNAIKLVGADGFLFDSGEGGSFL